MRRTACKKCALAVVAMLSVLGVVSVPAAAAVVTINGSPYDVYISDLGNIQAKADASANGVFYPPDDQWGDGGLFLGFPATPLTGEVAGPWPSSAQDATTIEYTAVSQGAVTGLGTSGSPYTQQTVYKVVNPVGSADVLRVTQTTRYVNGDSKFKSTYAVVNLTGSAVRFRASAAADLYIEGDDFGTGFLSAGPPRFVAGANQDVGRSGGIEEVALSTWSNYEVDYYGTIWTAVGDPVTGGFSNTLTPDLVDNGVGVEWNTHYGLLQGLAAGATRTFEVVWRFGTFVPLVLTPVVGSETVGSTHHVAATAKDVTGTPLVSKTVRYTVAGTNSLSGSTTTDGAGHADIAWTGTSEGTDNLTVFVDLNGDGTRQAAEPQVTATTEWSGSLPPPPEPPTPSPPPPPTASPPPPTKSACSGLKGKKLKRCKAVSKCKKIKNKSKRNKCLKKAKKIGKKKS